MREKIMKKTVSLLIAVSILLSCFAGTGFAAGNEAPFALGGSEKPTGSIESTNYLADFQTVTLTMNDDGGIAGYYWGTNPQYEDNAYISLHSLFFSSVKSETATQTVTSHGMYYFTVKDAGSRVSQTYQIEFEGIRLDAKGGSVTPENILVTLGSSVTLPVPQRYGYTFEGWKNELGSVFNSKYSVFEPECLEALWSHEHQYRKTVTKPTAGAIGFTENVCTVCAYSKLSNYTAPTGKLTLKHSSRSTATVAVSWGKMNTASGYQVQVSTKDGKKWSTSANLKAGVTSYTFKKLAAGNNYKFRVRFYVKAADGKNYYSPWSKTLSSPTLPAGTQFTKVKPVSKTQLQLSWKKVSGVTGYQVQIARDKAFQKNAKIYTYKGSTTTSKKIGGLRSNTMYYQRVRAYKVIGGKNYYSAWSKVFGGKMPK